MSKFISHFLLGTFLLSCQTQIFAKADPTHVTGKSWTNDQYKELFNKVLRGNPVTLFRIQKSSNTIKATINTIKHAPRVTPSEEAEFVKLQLNTSLELVKPFIDDIKIYKDIIKPLLLESLTHHKAHEQLLIKFLNSANPKESLETFTEREIKTVPQLEAILFEIQVFFADLFASLSQETKDAYKAFLTKNSPKQQKN